MPDDARVREDRRWCKMSVEQQPKEIGSSATLCHRHPSKQLSHMIKCCWGTLHVVNAQLFLMLIMDLDISSKFYSSAHQSAFHDLDTQRHMASLWNLRQQWPRLSMRFQPKWLMRFELFSQRDSLNWISIVVHGSNVPQVDDPSPPWQDEKPFDQSGSSNASSSPGRPTVPLLLQTKDPVMPQSCSLTLRSFAEGLTAPQFVLFRSLLKWLQTHWKHGGNTTVLWLTDA